MNQITFVTMKFSKTMSVPFNNLSRRVEANKVALRSILERVLESGWYILGTEGKDFETAFAARMGARFAVGLNSGTDALTLALRALNVGAGDEVITVANTAVPTVAAIRMTGAIPVFTDIDATYTLDPKDLEKHISKNTKVIMPVHLYGFPADMKAILAIANAYSIPVVEDSAQAHGASVDGVSVGRMGVCGAFSFYPTKNLGAFGDAGAVLTDDQSLMERLKRLRVYGEQSHYVSVEEGVNSRMDEFQAALLSWGLTQLDVWNKRRKEIATRYQKEITNPLVTMPVQGFGGRIGVWHLFVVQVPNRAHFMAYLKEKGIGSAIHYPTPIYRQEAYAFLRINPLEYPRTEAIVPHIVSLPLFPEMTNVEVEKVIVAVNSYSL